LIKVGVALPGRVDTWGVTHSDNAKELHIQYMAASFGVCGEEGDGEGLTRGGARSGKDGIRVFPELIWEWLKGRGGGFALVLKVM
jgi:hypothetical protein